MIITRTPFRVSFFGGGSDMPAFYRREPGAVLSVTIDRYMYVSAHPYFDRKSFHVKYSKAELVETRSAIEHPIVRRVCERLGIEGGIEIVSTADVPSGTGLGSSSAFTVGLLHLLYTYEGRHVPVSRLAHEACEVEIEDLGAPIGKQDQYASAHGGLNFIQFFPDEKVDVEPVPIRREPRLALESSLLMFYTGDQRSASKVLAEQQKVIASDESKFRGLKRMTEMAHEARVAIIDADIESFGRLLGEAWRIKREQAASITNPVIDAMYAKALDAGAWGGKLLGAGGGGFLLVAAPEDRHEAIRTALSGALELRVRFDLRGTKIVYTSDEF